MAAPTSFRELGLELELELELGLELGLGLELELDLELELESESELDSSPVSKLSMFIPEALHPSTKPEHVPLESSRLELAQDSNTYRPWSPDRWCQKRPNRRR